MARYFYNMRGTIPVEDKYGVEYASADQARMEAVRYFAEVLDSYSETFTSNTDLQLIISDEHGMTLLTYTFSVREASATQGDSPRHRKEQQPSLAGKLVA